jgi:hypothetical protein
MTNTKTLRTLDIKVTTREALWTQIYVSAMEAGFSPSDAKRQTDKAVQMIFEEIGPEKEALLRKNYNHERLRSRPIQKVEMPVYQPN